MNVVGPMEAFLAPNFSKSFLERNFDTNFSKFLCPARGFASSSRPLRVALPEFLDRYGVCAVMMIRLESDDTLQMNADTSATITAPLTTITGNLDVGSGVDVTGSITCSLDLNIEGDIDMASGKKVAWVDNSQYISGTTTGITIESDDTLQINADILLSGRFYLIINKFI